MLWTHTSIHTQRCIIQQYQQGALYPLFFVLRIYGCFPKIIEAGSHWQVHILMFLFKTAINHVIALLMISKHLKLNFKPSFIKQKTLYRYVVIAYVGILNFTLNVQNVGPFNREMFFLYIFYIVYGSLLRSLSCSSLCSVSLKCVRCA